MAEEKMDLNFDQGAAAGAAAQADPFAGMAVAEAPSLTFGDEAETQAAQAPQAAMAEPEENVLTPEELRHVEEFAPASELPLSPVGAYRIADLRG